MKRTQPTLPGSTDKAISSTGQRKTPSTAVNQTRRKEVIRVLLADDHPVVRHGLTSCLATHGHFAVIGEAANGREAIEMTKNMEPDVILMDIDMPHINGLRATEILRREKPDLEVIILSTLRHPEYMQQVLNCGASAYVLKEAAPEELIQAIEAVHEGQTFFSPGFARIALSRFVNGTSNGARLNQLSNREQEVLVAVAEGLSNKEIASNLGIAVCTVATHREAIMRKLNIHSVAGLTRFAAEKGLIALPKESDITGLAISESGNWHPTL